MSSSGSENFAKSSKTARKKLSRLPVLSKILKKRSRDNMSSANELSVTDNMDDRFKLNLKSLKALDDIGSETMQRNTFTKWVNNHLEMHNSSGRVKNLYTDLCDGVLLCHLIEVLTGDVLPVNQRAGDTNAQRVYDISNLTTALSALKRNGLDLVNVNPTDLADGNPRIVLGLIWKMVLHFQVKANLRLLHEYEWHYAKEATAAAQRAANISARVKTGILKELLDDTAEDFLDSMEPSTSAAAQDRRRISFRRHTTTFEYSAQTSQISLPTVESDKGVTPRKSRFASPWMLARAGVERKLLKWVNDEISDNYHIDIRNFDSDWCDGIAFCALVHRFFPALINMRRVRELNTPAENLQLAFERARIHLNIKPLLNINEMTRKDRVPDKCSVIMYLSQFLAFISPPSAPAPDIAVQIVGTHDKSTGLLDFLPSEFNATRPYLCWLKETMEDETLNKVAVNSTANGSLAIEEYMRYIRKRTEFYEYFLAYKEIIEYIPAVGDAKNQRTLIEIEAKWKHVSDILYVWNQRLASEYDTISALFGAVVRWVDEGEHLIRTTAPSMTRFDTRHIDASMARIETTLYNFDSFFRAYPERRDAFYEAYNKFDNEKRPENDALLSLLRQRFDELSALYHVETSRLLLLQAYYRLLAFLAELKSRTRLWSNATSRALTRRWLDEYMKAEAEHPEIRLENLLLQLSNAVPEEQGSLRIQGEAMYLELEKEAKMSIRQTLSLGSRLQCWLTLWENFDAIEARLCSSSGDHCNTIVDNCGEIARQIATEDAPAAVRQAVDARMRRLREIVKAHSISKIGQSSIVKRHKISNESDDVGDELPAWLANVERLLRRRATDADSAVEILKKIEHYQQYLPASQELPSVNDCSRRLSHRAEKLYQLMPALLDVERTLETMEEWIFYHAPECEIANLSIKERADRLNAVGDTLRQLRDKNFVDAVDVGRLETVFLHVRSRISFVEIHEIEIRVEVIQTKALVIRSRRRMHPPPIGKPSGDLTSANILKEELCLYEQAERDSAEIDGDIAGVLQTLNEVSIATGPALTAALGSSSDFVDQVAAEAVLRIASLKRKIEMHQRRASLEHDASQPSSSSSGSPPWRGRLDDLLQRKADVLQRSEVSEQMARSSIVEMSMLNEAIQTQFREATNNKSDVAAAKVASFQRLESEWLRKKAALDRLLHIFTETRRLERQAQKCEAPNQLATCCAETNALQRVVDTALGVDLPLLTLVRERLQSARDRLAQLTAVQERRRRREEIALRLYALKMSGQEDLGIAEEIVKEIVDEIDATLRAPEVSTNLTLVDNSAEAEFDEWRDIRVLSDRVCGTIAHKMEFFERIEAFRDRIAALQRLADSCATIRSDEMEMVVNTLDDTIADTCSALANERIQLEAAVCTLQSEFYDVERDRIRENLEKLCQKQKTVAVLFENRRAFLSHLADYRRVVAECQNAIAATSAANCADGSDVEKMATDLNALKSQLHTVAERLIRAQRLAQMNVVDLKIEETIRQIYELVVPGTDLLGLLERAARVSESLRQSLETPLPNIEPNILIAEYAGQLKEKTFTEKAQLSQMEELKRQYDITASAHAARSKSAEALTRYENVTTALATLRESAARRDDECVQLIYRAVQIAVQRLADALTAFDTEPAVSLDKKTTLVALTHDIDALERDSAAACAVSGVRLPAEYSAQWIRQFDELRTASAAVAARLAQAQADAARDARREQKLLKHLGGFGKWLNLMDTEIDATLAAIDLSDAQKQRRLADLRDNSLYHAKLVRRLEEFKFSNNNQIAEVNICCQRYRTLMARFGDWRLPEMHDIVVRVAQSEPASQMASATTATPIIVPWPAPDSRSVSTYTVDSEWSQTSLSSLSGAQTDNMDKLDDGFDGLELEANRAASIRAATCPSTDPDDYLRLIFTEAQLALDKGDPAPISAIETAIFDILTDVQQLQRDYHPCVPLRALTLSRNDLRRLRVSVRQMNTARAELRRLAARNDDARLKRLARRLRHERSTIKLFYRTLENEIDDETALCVNYQQIVGGLVELESQVHASRPNKACAAIDRISLALELLKKQTRRQRRYVAFGIDASDKSLSTRAKIIYRITNSVTTIINVIELGLNNQNEGRGQIQAPAEFSTLRHQLVGLSERARVELPLESFDDELLTSTGPKIEAAPEEMSTPLSDATRAKTQPPPKAVKSIEHIIERSTSAVKTFESLKNAAMDLLVDVEKNADVIAVVRQKCEEKRIELEKTLREPKTDDKMNEDVATANLIQSYTLLEDSLFKKEETQRADALSHRLDEQIRAGERTLRDSTADVDQMANTLKDIEITITDIDLSTEAGMVAEESLKLVKLRLIANSLRAEFERADEARRLIEESVQILARVSAAVSTITEAPPQPANVVRARMDELESNKCELQELRARGVQLARLFVDLPIRQQIDDELHEYENLLIDLKAELIADSDRTARFAALDVQITDAAAELTRGGTLPSELVVALRRNVHEISEEPPLRYLQHDDRSSLDLVYSKLTKLESTLEQQRLPKKRQELEQQTDKHLQEQQKLQNLEKQQELQQQSRKQEEVIEQQLTEKHRLEEDQKSYNLEKLQQIEQQYLPEAQQFDSQQSNQKELTQQSEQGKKQLYLDRQQQSQMEEELSREHAEREKPKTETEKTKETPHEKKLSKKDKKKTKKAKRKADEDEKLKKAKEQDELAMQKDEEEEKAKKAKKEANEAEAELMNSVERQFDASTEALDLLSNPDAILLPDHYEKVCQQIVDQTEKIQGQLAITESSEIIAGHLAAGETFVRQLTDRRAHWLAFIELKQKINGRLDAFRGSLDQLEPINGGLKNDEDVSQQLDEFNCQHSTALEQLSESLDKLRYLSDSLAPLKSPAADIRFLEADYSQCVERLEELTTIINDELVDERTSFQMATDLAAEIESIRQNIFETDQIDANKLCRTMAKLKERSKVARQRYEEATAIRRFVRPAEPSANGLTELDAKLKERIADIRRLECKVEMEKKINKLWLKLADVGENPTKGTIQLLRVDLASIEDISDGESNDIQDIQELRKKIEDLANREAHREKLKSQVDDLLESLSQKISESRQLIQIPKEKAQKKEKKNSSIIEKVSFSDLEAKFELLKRNVDELKTDELPRLRTARDDLTNAKYDTAPHNQRITELETGLDEIKNILAEVKTEIEFERSLRIEAGAILNEVDGTSQAVADDSVAVYDEMADKITTIQQRCDEWNESFKISTKYLKRDKVLDTTDVQKQLKHLTLKLNARKTVAEKRQKLVELRPRLEADIIALKSELDELTKTPPSLLAEQEATVKDLEVEKTKLKSLFDDIPDLDEAADLRSIPNIELDRLSELIDKLKKSIDEKSAALNSFLKLKSDLEAQLENIGNAIERADSADLNAVIDQQKQVEAIRVRLAEDVYVDVLDDDHQNELELLRDATNRLDNNLKEFENNAKRLIAEKQQKYENLRKINAKNDTLITAVHDAQAVLNNAEAAPTAFDQTFENLKAITSDIQQHLSEDSQMAMYQLPEVAKNLSVAEKLIGDLKRRRDDWLEFVRLKIAINRSLDTACDELECIQSASMRTVDVVRDDLTKIVETQQFLNLLFVNLDEMRSMGDRLYPLEAVQADVRFLEADHEQIAQKLEQLATNLNDEIQDETELAKQNKELEDELNRLSQIIERPDINLIELRKIEEDELGRLQKSYDNVESESLKDRKYVKPSKSHEKLRESLTDIKMSIKSRIQEMEQRRSDKFKTKYLEVAANPSLKGIEKLQKELESIPEDYFSLNDIRLDLIQLADKELQKSEHLKKINEVLNEAAQTLSKTEYVPSVTETSKSKKTKAKKGKIKIQKTEIEKPIATTSIDKATWLRKRIKKLETNISAIEQIRKESLVLNLDVKLIDQQLDKLRTTVDALKTDLNVVESDIKAAEESMALIEDIERRMSKECLAAESTKNIDEMRHKLAEIQNSSESINSMIGQLTEIDRTKLDDSQIARLDQCKKSADDKVAKSRADFEQLNQLIDRAEALQKYANEIGYCCLEIDTLLRRDKSLRDVVAAAVSIGEAEALAQRLNEIGTNINKIKKNNIETDNATVDEQKFEIEEQLGRLQNFAEELRKALDELAIQRSRKDELAKKIDQLAEEANRIKFINDDNDKLNIVEILEKEKEIVRIKLDELTNEKENKGTMVIEDDLQLSSLDEKLTRLSNRISLEKLNAERMFQLCTTFDTVQQIIDTVTLAAEQNPEADEIAFKKALSDLTEIDQHLESIQKSADSFNVDDTSENSIKINVMSRLSQTVEELNNLRQAVGDRLESLQDFNESAKTIYSELKILEDFDAEKATADETGARCGASRAISEQIAKLRSCLKKLTPLSMPQATVVDLEQQLNKIVAFWEAAAASAAEKEQEEENKRKIEQLIGKINKKMKALKKKIIDSSELNSQQIDTIINRSIGPLNQEVEGIAKNKNFKLENDRLQLQSDLQSIESQLRKRLDEIQSRNQLETEIRLQIDECEVELADLERFHSNAVRPPTDAKSTVERLYAIRQTIANRSLEELQNDRARESLEEQCRALDHRIDKLMASLESEMQLEAQFRYCSNNLNDRISELKSNYITINANKDSSETAAELAQHLAKVEELMKEEGEICEIESHQFKYILHDKTADTASIQIVQLAKDAEMLKAAFVQHQKLAELWPQVEAHRVVLNIQLTNLENQLPTTQQAQEITVNELETERDTLKSLLDGITDSDEASELKKEFELELNRLSELINKLNKAIGEKSMALNSFLTLKSDVEAQLKDIGQTIERTDPADLNAVIDQQKQLAAIQERFSNDVYVNELDEDHKIELENLFKLLETFNGKIERRQKLAELRPQVEAETLALRNKLDRLWTHPTTVLKNQQATLEDLVADDQRLRPILNDLACFDPAENLKKELQIELNRLVQDIKRYSNIVNEKSVYLSAWPSLKSELQDKIEEVWIAVGQSDPINRNAIIDHENAIKAIKDQMFDNIKTYLMGSTEIEELDSINDNLKDLTEKLTFRRNLSEIFDDGEQPNQGVLNKVPTTSSADEMAVTDLKKKRTKLKSLLVSIPKLKTRKACELELEQLTELINELGKTSNASNDFLTLESEIDSRLKNVGKAIERANLSYMTVAIKRGKKMIAARGRLTCTHKLEDDLKAKLETIDNDSGNQTYQHEEAKKIGKIDQPESQNRELVEMLEGVQQLLIDPKAIPSRYEEMAHQLENQTVFKFRRILDDSSDCIKKIPEEIIKNLQLAAEIKAELLRRHTAWLAFAERRATANRQLDMARDYLSNSTAGELRDLDTAKIELAVLEDTQKSLFDMADGLKELRSLGDQLEPLEAPHVDIRFLETDLEQTDKFIITVVCDLRNEIETESRLLDECQQIESELNKLGERADEQFKLDFLQKAQRELYPIRDRLEQLGVRQTTSKNSRKYIRYKSDRIQTLKAKFDKTDAKIRQKIQNSEEQIIEELSAKYAKLAENPSVEDVEQLESELKAMHTESDKIEKLRKSLQELANDQTAKQNVKARASEAISRFQEQGSSISKLGQQEKKIGKKKKQKEIMKEQELEKLVDPDEKLTKLRKNFQKLESEIIPSVEKSHDEIVTAGLDDKTHNQRVEEIQTISDRLKIEICDVIRSVEEIDKITSKLQRLKRSRDELGTQSAADFTPEEYMQYLIQKRDKITEMTSELRNINKPVTLATNLPLAAAIDAAVRRADEAVRFLDAEFIDAGIRIKIDNKMAELQKTIDVNAKKYRSQQVPCSVAAATEDLTRLEAKNEELSELADEINDKAKESKDYTTKEVLLSKSKEVQDQKTQLEYLLFMLRHNLNDVQELEAENSQICDEIDRLSTIRLDDSIPENQLEKLTGLQKELNIIHEKLNVFASRIENRDKFSPLVEYNPQVQYLHKLLSELKNSNNSEKKIVAEAILQKQIEYEFDKFSKIIDEADLVDSNPNVTAENIEVALHNLEQIEGIFEKIQHLSDSQSSAEDPSCRQSALNRLAEFGEEFANLRRSLEDRQGALRRFDESANAIERQIYKLQFVELLTSKENQCSDQAYDQDHKHLLQDIEDQRNIGDQIGEQITKMRIDLNENLGSALPNNVEERLAELERCQKTAVEKINQIYDSVIREQEAERHQKFEMKFAEKLSVIDYKMNVTEKNLEEEIPSLASVVRIQNEELEPIRVNIDGIREEKPPTEELSKRKNSVLYRFGVLEASLKQHLRELDEQERISSRLENEISSYEAKLETLDRYHRDDLRSPDEAENTIEQLKEKIDRETAQDLTLTSQMVDRKSPVSDMKSDVTENKSKTKATPKVPISEESKMLETSSDRNEHCVETRKIDKKFSKKQKGRKIGTNTFTEQQPELTVNFDPEQKKIQTKEGETTPIVADTTKTQFGESQKSRKECEDNRLDEQSNQPGRLKAGDDQLNISEAEVSSERTEKPSYDVEEAEKVFAAIFRDQDPTDMLRQQGFDDEDLLDLESSDDDAPDHGELTILSHKEGTGLSAAVESAAPAVNTVVQPAAGVNRWRRILRAALPLQAMLVLLLGAACLVPHCDDDYCCHLLNNFASTFESQLDFVNGPPPF